MNTLKQTLFEKQTAKIVSIDTGVDRWGTGGTRPPPHFSAWGDSIGIVPPPHFSAQKNCEAYSLTHHSSLLKAATQD